MPVSRALSYHSHHWHVTNNIVCNCIATWNWSDKAPMWSKISNIQKVQEVRDFNFHWTDISKACWTWGEVSTISQKFTWYLKTTFFQKKMIPKSSKKLMPHMGTSKPILRILTLKKLLMYHLTNLENDSQTYLTTL